MSLFISSLNSGSNGNCYYVGNKSEALLFDAGISCREVEKRMLRLGLSMKTIKGIFISHEHGDHTKGVAAISNKYKIPIYMSRLTAAKAVWIKSSATYFFSADECIQLGGLTVNPFSKYHDATDPYSFTVSYKDLEVGIFTDIGRPCDKVIANFKRCHAAFLEANYDQEMLENGFYPYYLKRRISGGMGHLSNKQALDIFLKFRPSFMSHLVLSHLSKNNNCPELCADLFAPHAGNVEICVASRYNESKIFEIGKANKTKSPIYVQTCLFCN